MYYNVKHIYLIYTSTESKGAQIPYICMSHSSMKFRISNIKFNSKTKIIKSKCYNFQKKKKIKKENKKEEFWNVNTHLAINMSTFKF